MRLHLFELEDQSWFPSTIRDLATDYLQFIQTRFRIDRAMTPLIRRLHGDDRHDAASSISAPADPGRSC